MSDRSVFSALSLFVVVVVGLSLHPGNTALALEQDHGNPGQFIDNIRKGISGLSKYFWSPKAQIPGERTEQPEKGTTKSKEASPAITAPAAIAKKQAGKSGQMIEPDNKMARVPASPKNHV